MTDLLFQIGLSNACFSLALALVAMVMGARARRPHLAHMLWLLVFVKLVTPPILTIPVGIFSVQPDRVVAAGDNREFDADEQPAIAEKTTVSSLLSGIATAADRAKPWLVSIWLPGSVVVFAWSLVRVYRFSRLLATEAEVAPQALQTAAERMARRLGLKTIPTICTTSTHLSPMVWWAGGKVQVVVPAALFDQLDAQQSQWILAHELAHVRRRDHLVRWLEWLGCVCFWWNPVVWWAQRNLRAMEEICCDDLVISCLNPKPKSYANSLLSAVEFLARPALRPPAVASEINSGGVLERRFKMIVSETPKRSNTRRLQACVLACAMAVLPLGIASAQDYKAVERRLGEAVSNGELSLEQAGVMMDALRKTGGVKTEAGKGKSDTDLESVWKKLQAMVKAGELTQEQANAKMSAIKAEAAKKDQDADRAKVYLMKVKNDLGAAVEAGRISREDAAKRYEAAEKGIKERMAAGGQDDSRRISREDYARAEADLKKAVADGRISEEDARARLNGMRKMMAEQSQRGDMRAEYEGFERRIRAAVEAGKMTREEAAEKLDGYRRRMAMTDSGGDKRAEYEGLERRLRAAVEAGRMTREEAAERFKAYKERMDQER